MDSQEVTKKRIFLFDRVMRLVDFNTVDLDFSKHWWASCSPWLAIFDAGLSFHFICKHVKSRTHVCFVSVSPQPFAHEGC